MAVFALSGYIPTDFEFNTMTAALQIQLRCTVNDLVNVMNRIDSVAQDHSVSGSAEHLPGDCEICDWHGAEMLRLDDLSDRIENALALLGHES